MPNKKHIHINDDGVEFYNDNGFRNCLNPNNANTSDFYNIMPTNSGTLLAITNTPTNGQTAQYDGDTGTWRAVSVSGGGGTGYTTIAKTVDQSVTNSNSLQDDNELTFTLDANSTYMFDLGISVSATTPSHKIGFTAPSGAVGVFNTNKDISGGTSDTYTNSNGGVGTSVRGFIRTTASGGAFTLQWAQDFADGTASTVKAGSFLSYVKVVG